jgi:hypothetical protein
MPVTGLSRSARVARPSELGKLPKGALDGSESDGSALLSKRGHQVVACLGAPRGVS